MGGEGGASGRCPRSSPARSNSRPRPTPKLAPRDADVSRGGSGRGASPAAAPQRLRRGPRRVGRRPGAGRWRGSSAGRGDRRGDDVAAASPRRAGRSTRRRSVSTTSHPAASSARFSPISSVAIDFDFTTNAPSGRPAAASRDDARDGGVGGCRVGRPVDVATEGQHIVGELLEHGGEVGQQLALDAVCGVPQRVGVGQLGQALGTVAGEAVDGLAQAVIAARGRPRRWRCGCAAWARRRWRSGRSAPRWERRRRPRREPAAAVGVAAGAAAEAPPSRPLAGAERPVEEVGQVAYGHRRADRLRSGPQVEQAREVGADDASAPRPRNDPSFSSAMASAASGSLRLNVPPKPQQRCVSFGQGRPSTRRPPPPPPRVAPPPPSSRASGTTGAGRRGSAGPCQRGQPASHEELGELAGSARHGRAAARRRCRPPGGTARASSG